MNEPLLSSSTSQAQKNPCCLPSAASLIQHPPILNPSGPIPSMIAPLRRVLCLVDLWRPQPSPRSTSPHDTYIPGGGGTCSHISTSLITNTCLQLRGSKDQLTELYPEPAPGGGGGGGAAPSSGGGGGGAPPFCPLGLYPICPPCCCGCCCCCW